MKVTAIQTGEVQLKERGMRPRFGSRPARVLDILADRRWAPRMPILCFAIEHPDGTILVDTGESSAFNEPGYVPRWHVFLKLAERLFVSPATDVAPRLRAAGIEPDSVRQVVLTHMHADHAGGIGAFPNAEFVVTAAEAELAFARLGPVNGYLNMHYPPWFRPRRIVFDGDPWEGFEASLPLTSDRAVRLIPTPGHTTGHMSVVVEQSDRLVLLTGDAAYSETALLEGRIDGVTQDARAHRRTTARLRALCGRRDVVVAPSHDPGTVRRLAT